MSVDVDFTRRKQMGIIAQEEATLMSSKSNLEVLEDILKLDWEDLEMGNTIGYGGFSQVFKVQILKPIDGQYDDREFALKCLNSNTMERTKSFKTGAVDLALEANILCRLSHPNVIKVHAVHGKGPRTAYIDSDRGFFLVLDLLADTLRDKIDKYRLQNPKMRKAGLSLNTREAQKTNSSAVLERIKSIGIGVAMGMEYLHQQGVVLRDLKPDNVGFCPRGVPKIFDLGFAREVHTLKPKEVAGSLRYMAPEIALGRPTEYASDVYSFGVLLWEMVTLEKPYKHIQDREEFIESVMIDGWRPSSSGMPSSAIRKLVKECWDGNPSHRPTFSKIVKVLRVETVVVGGGMKKSGASLGMPLPRTATFADTSALSKKHSLGKLSSLSRKISSNSPFGMMKNRMSKGNARSTSSKRTEDTSASSYSEEDEPRGGGKNATFNLGGGGGGGSSGSSSKSKLNPKLANSLLGTTSKGSSSSGGGRGNSSKKPTNEYHTGAYFGEETMTLNDKPKQLKRTTAGSTRRFARSKSNSSCPDLTEE